MQSQKQRVQDEVSQRFVTLLNTKARHRRSAESGPPADAPLLCGHRLARRRPQATRP